MKKLLLLASIGCFLGSGLTSCEEEEFTRFDGSKSGIYIQSVTSTNLAGTPQGFTDSITFSFSGYTEDVVEYNIQVPVRIMGNVADHDRAFVMKVDTEKSTAQADVHYKFDPAKCIIPAGKSGANIPVTILRHKDLTTKYLRIELTLESNNEFTVELEEYKNSPFWDRTSKLLDGGRYKIIFSDQITKPDWWDFMSCNNIYGEWSAAKEKRLNKLMGWTHRQWLNWKVPYGQMPFGAKMLKRELQALADAGTPVREDNGEFMQLPEPYSVDYSKYE